MATSKTSPRADPLPLGLSGLALPAFVLGNVNAGFLKGAGDVKVVIGLAVFAGGLVPVLAGMWEFYLANTFLATAFTAYGAFWLSFAALYIPGFNVSLGIGGLGPSNAAIGTTLLGWAIFTAILVVGAFQLNGGLAAVSVLLFITFVVGGVGLISNTTSLVQVSGYTEMLTAIAAWYVAAAGVLDSVSRGRIALPLWPLARAS